MSKAHHLAHALRAARRRQGKSQSEVAMLAHTTQATVARWEVGDRHPTLTSAARWAFALRYALMLRPLLTNPEGPRNVSPYGSLIISAKIASNEQRWAWEELQVRIAELVAEYPVLEFWVESA